MSYIRIKDLVKMMDDLSNEIEIAKAAFDLHSTLDPPKTGTEGISLNTVGSHDTNPFPAPRVKPERGSDD